MNMETEIAAMITSVMAAFFASGGLNAGTPLDTASTPVIAVQPFANARRTRKVPTVPLAAGKASRSSGAAGCPPTVKYRQAPKATSDSTLTMKK
jgi:hypothetical protein